MVDSVRELVCAGLFREIRHASFRPKMAVDHRIEILTCQEALELGFNEIMDKTGEPIAVFVLVQEGMASGWGEFDVKRAIRARARGAMEIATHPF